MKLLILLLSLITLLPSCCWSGRIPRCHTCQPCNMGKALSHDYDDTQYNDEINI
jgi:hypothetical protein